ncbi:MAG: carbamoyltransferase C-terminal domain-containing protein [Candidatus Alcyoniella australis]|nr:carbamoyltransferase C-terminal domain-containing protein [Candidatus Alcyoniella australis]
MIVLGICDGHDAGACLLRDGEIVHAVSEERLTRRKRQPGFPLLAIEECLRCSGLGWSQVELVAVAERAGRAVFRVLDPWYRRSDPNQLLLRPTNRLARKLHRMIHSSRWTRELDESLSRQALSARLRSVGYQGPLAVVDHHQAHLASALMYSGMRDPLILSIDAYGDGSSGAAALLDRHDPQLREIERMGIENSPAQFFGAVASLLGFVEGEEGKVSALAPLARGDRALSMLRQGLDPDGEPRVEQLIDLAGRVLEQFGDHELAAAAQTLLEQLVSQKVSALLESTGRDELAAAGGVFANVGLNRVISRLPGLRRMFVFPHMGDGGLCAGAAAAVALEHGIEPAPQMEHCSLGAQFGPERIAIALEDAGLQSETLIDAPQRVSDMLDAGKVVGLFQGRAEFGPRALGQRSILFSAAVSGLPAKVSRMIERDPIMPFAPATIDERFNELYDEAAAGPCAPLMTAAFKLRNHAAQLLPNAVHADGTARAQRVERQATPLHALLKCVPNGTLCNTSFNMHREPIVHTPEDAVATYLASGLDALWIGERLVVR